MLLDVGRLEGITVVSEQTVGAFTGNICRGLREGKSARSFQPCLFGKPAPLLK